MPRSGTNFVKNVMEIAVPPSNPAHITAVADLAKSGVKVALCQQQVPCGATAYQVFKNAGITVKPVTEEADVKSTLTKVESNAVDAGVVYVTDVRVGRQQGQGHPHPGLGQRIDRVPDRRPDQGPERRPRPRRSSTSSCPKPARRC